jgi:uncharacterized protein
MYICAYALNVNLEWDCRKAASNLKKHGIDFAEAALVFYDELAITIREMDSGEERFITLGMDALARVLVVTYAWRGDRIRIISARKATPRERHEYENSL